ncbi:MAG: ATP-binding protein, partial [Odoribacter splanchnicus]
MAWQDFVNEQIGSLPANPTIANVFYRRGTMEAWGRGIGLIMESCREQALPT